MYQYAQFRFKNSLQYQQSLESGRGSGVDQGYWLPIPLQAGIPDNFKDL